MDTMTKTPPVADCMIKWLTEPEREHRIMIDLRDGTKRVWGSVAGYWMTCHELPQPESAGFIHFSGVTATCPRGV